MGHLSPIVRTANNGSSVEISKKSRVCVCWLLRAPINRLCAHIMYGEEFQMKLINFHEWDAMGPHNDAVFSAYFWATMSREKERDKIGP